MEPKYVKIHAIIPIVFGSLILIYQFANMNTFITFFFEPKEKYTGILGVDNILNLIVPFFFDFLTDPVGLIIGNQMTPMALVSLFTIALESSIPGVNSVRGINGFFTSFLFVAITMQLLGIATAIKREESDVIVVINDENRQDIEAPPVAAADATLPLNPDRVTRIFLGIVCVVFSSLVVMSLVSDPSLQFWTIIFFQISPVLAFMFWFWTPKGAIKESVSTNEGYKRASKYYLILFGICLYSWVSFLAYCVDHNAAYLSTLLEQLRNHELAAATDFMLVSTTGLTISMFYWVYLLEGAQFTPAFWKLLGFGVVTSPAGALALYGSERWSGNEKGKGKSRLSSIKSAQYNGDMFLLFQ
ncbi:13059_t:CDS:2 [Dentiscutata erythropus]|uniref:13059_t:CDS:1 n=1 Tax=Dentiscutata erythropus TaxID=1348616 RepID=A0A9N9DL34_9GLOM|nr:13059_t:CDS:2 [Dentiscutata erythropus]